jgi:MarR family transcriptional regulator, transcriptional regulator for hemolysin
MSGVIEVAARDPGVGSDDIDDRWVPELLFDERLAPATALAEAHGAVAEALHRLAMDPLGIDVATADLLVQLSRSPECGIRGVQIGEQCQMTATRVSRLVDRAEADRLVERQPDPEDRRAQHVVLTAKGREVAQRYAPLMDAVLSDVFFEGLSERDRATLVGLLDRVTERARSLLGARGPRA